MRRMNLRLVAVFDPDETDRITVLQFEGIFVDFLQSFARGKMGASPTSWHEDDDEKSTDNKSPSMP
jgi:hypothetical protein